jgi:hypothetical protein
MIPKMLLALRLVVAAIAVSAEESQPVSIAMLREDGYLVPVATIVGSRYEPLLTQSTITSSENTAVFTLAARRLAGSTWSVVRTSGETMDLTVLNRAKVRNHCMFEEAWRTSFKGKPVPAYDADFAKIGIAVRGGTAEQPQDVTSQPDEASRRIASLVLRRAASEEAIRLAKDPNILKDYLTQTARLEVTKLFRHTSAGTATYFFETTKTPFPLMTRGWIVDSASGTAWRDVRFTVSDDVYKEVCVGTVIGLVSLPDRTLWLMEWHGYEGEGQAIHEWPSGAIRLRTPGAGC